MTVNRDARPDRTDALQHSPQAGRCTLDRAPSAATWLASAHPRPAEVHEAWTHPYGVAALPCNGPFTAVRLPENVVGAAVECDDPAAVRARLAAALHGPVIHDPQHQRYYALVPAGVARGWRVPGVECLGSEYYLGVPDPAAIRPSGMCGYWAVPMDGPGHLCDPVAVEELARVGRERVAAGAVRWCNWHHGHARGTELVSIIEQMSGPGASLYACADCRAAHRLTPLAEGGV
ncbi:hypothetical protein [Streptomyces sp. NPDC050560]|uniref:hypothetical protein n=1 Tax=Streptomyces sp. NPDC050560 TaxID=3365630 RepID=UPI0037A14C92